MSTKPSVCFNISPKPVPVTTKDIGVQLACDNADKQAEIFRYMRAEIATWPHDLGPWSIQCREIATCLTDAECVRIRGMFDVLVQHLEAIPQARRVAKTTEAIVGAVASAIGGEA